MEDEDHISLLEESYVYVVIRIDSNSNGITTDVVGVYRDKKVANKLLYTLMLESKGAFSISYQISRALF